MSEAEHRKVFYELMRKEIQTMLGEGERATLPRIDLNILAKAAFRANYPPRTEEQQALCELAGLYYKEEDEHET